jgi:phosphoglycerate dehydrogenase-like enzyme
MARWCRTRSWFNSADHLPQGYGHIAREAARLLKAFNLNIIAANSTGKQTVDEGYIVPGTGDKDGSIPSTYFTTTGSSFDEFLSKTDILICSLPSTKSTVHLLTAQQFRKLKPGAIFINVGRGDIVVTDDLLTVLDEDLYGAALDVTDPEPLPDGHPLFLHPRVVITPHSYRDFAGYNDAATELFLANAERLRRGEKPYNIADAERGY